MISKTVDHLCALNVLQKFPCAQYSLLFVAFSRVRLGRMRQPILLLTGPMCFHVGILTCWLTFNLYSMLTLFNILKHGNNFSFMHTQTINLDKVNCSSIKRKRRLCHNLNVCNHHCNKPL